MKVDNGPSPAINPGVWEQREMRMALARRDLTTVYHRLQRVGVSQRRIATLTGQSSSEVYEILKGRKVMAYDVLVRIADGLGVPRGYLGLAYDEFTETAVELAATSATARSDERDEVRDLLSHAANLTMAATVDSTAAWWQPVDRQTTPVPTRIGMSDVEQLEHITSILRGLDARHGGGACRDAVIAQVTWAQQLLTAEGNETVIHRLQLAVADLHLQAGWTSFDVGLDTSARRHLARALELARAANDASLIAKLLYCMGRLHLHRKMFRDGLRFFQLGQIAAQDSGCELTVALLCVNEAWAYALLGDSAQALKSLGRAQDEFARADHGTAPSWVRFFGTADHHASAGVTYASLPDATNSQLERGVELLNRSLTQRGPDMTRSRVFELSALATAYLRIGDYDCGITAGKEAVELAATVRSVRTPDPLTLGRLTALLGQVCAQAGVDPGGATLVKFTNNAVFRLTRDPVVVRIAGSGAVRAKVPKVVAVARWLANHDLPSARLLDGIEQPVQAGGHLATLWHQVPATGPAATGSDLAAILRQFHALPPPSVPLPAWRPVAPIRERIAEARCLSDEDLTFLLATCDETEAGLDALHYVLPPGPIHGDATVGNLIPGPDGPVICDFDSTSTGPREWDLTPATLGRLRFNYPVDIHGQLSEAYGVDVTTWSGFPVLRRLRELQLVTSVLPVLDSNPGLRDQWERRYRSFRDGDDEERWEMYT